MPSDEAGAITPDGARWQASADPGALDRAVIDRMDAFIRSNRQLNWKVVQRGFWVHGVNDLRAYLASAELFTMQGRANLIRCPTLITRPRMTLLRPTPTLSSMPSNAPRR